MAGRPRIEIDEDQFRKLCALQCTLEEIAAWFKCSEDAIERWCQREHDMHFADYYKRHSAMAKSHYAVGSLLWLNILCLWLSF